MGAPFNRHSEDWFINLGLAIPYLGERENALA
jgi:hypothetical protein